ncbi:neural-cadherin isoform X7 [Brachionus plicatilis]|uniref:Neural-cadherin isoform X7 n=1 Tax=Brachionus plicatilis TaxID=10195 RepID=A0A3M7SRG0_BRAPC|nr:neural-cadherin isoform X7 [Brachionus plicatilis]
MSTRIIFLALSIVYFVVADECFTYKRLSVDDLNEHPIEIELNAASTICQSFTKRIKAIYTLHLKNVSSELYDESLFEFQLNSENRVEFLVKKTQIIDQLIDATFVFDLNLTCDLVIDFYQPNIESFIDDLTALVNLNRAQSFLFTQTHSTLTHIKMDKLLTRPDSNAYSVVCLKCDINNKELSSVNMSISEHVLVLQVEQFSRSDLVYNDVILLVEQSKTRLYLVVRVFRPNSHLDHLVFNLEEKRQKRYSNPLMYMQSAAHLSSMPSSNFNMLKTAQLAITEETVGLQTKLKIYDFVWMDYQINASNYVKERIQLIAPDNPILNITRPFDYELGGPMHTFQIVFTRKIDKRVVKDIKPINIKVIDVNDEPPVWKMDEPVPYTAVVERDPRPGQLVFEFVAEDPDSQSHIVYTLHSKSPNTTRLTMKEGKIYTVAGPPFQFDTYKILVSAHDAKAANVLHSASPFSHVHIDTLRNNTQEIFAELTISVGKKAPQFYQSEYKVNISESAPIGHSVVEMRAKSFNPDALNKKHLRYSLETRHGQSAEFSIYSENGTVILARKVDYETDKREFNLVVRVTEQSGWLLSSSARLTVYIEDHNDNSPQFTLSEYVRTKPVAEDIEADTFIIQVEVQDRDSGANGEIEWQVSDANFYIRPYSSAQSKRARIYNAGTLDFEIPQHMYRFDVVGCDRGEPRLCASAKVSVPVSNVNDEKPKFDQKVILATLDENVPPGAYVTTVQASDGDGDRIFFSLKDQSAPFEINRESGIVKVKVDRQIDPKEDYYNLTVYAEDDGSCCCLSSHRAVDSNCKVKTNREEATLVIKIRDINDHAPKFYECDNYSRLAQVQEEMAVGTKVIQVEAIDADKGENGQVEYEILSTHNERNQPFRIDAATGLITTNVVFDRESNNKYNEYSITVKAKDKGKPHPLSDACSFRIKILDINDHAPFFYETEYKLSIKYNAQPGHNIHRLIASDADSGKNAEIKYRIETGSAQTARYADHFGVDESTGMISLRKALSPSVPQPIVFTLIAQDQGEPALSSSVVVSLSFADRDNEPPKWLAETEKRFERVVRIPEAISLNQVVETLDAESNYAPNSKLIFDFSPRPQPESFIIQQDKIPGTNRYRGKIIVYQPLDAETQNFYELHVRVQNAAAQPMEITGLVRVEILDSNDNMPLFTSPTYLANVSENSPPNTYVTKVTAVDKDISAPNNLVVYSINEPDASRKFQIDPYTGNITTRVVLDREQTKVYFIDISACDSAMSDRPNMNSPNCRTANVRIDVADTNDNAPYFNYSLYEASVVENSERGTPIITIQANDLDENAQLRYLIADGNDQNVFGVRESIGEIYVANNAKLDYEMFEYFYLTLTVSDGIHNASCKVTISLLDVNDNPPQFTQVPPYEIELIEEDLSFPRVILKINATDGDTKRPNTIVYKINYNYTQNASTFRPFSIDEHTGEIILDEKLDRDYPNGRPVWSFNVIASDEGGLKGCMDSTAVVNVRLTDINDNAPVFDRPPYLGHIMENSAPATLIMTVTANDYDDPSMGHNAVLRYQIAENKKFGNMDVFSINETSGQIFQNIKLDREQIDKYTIEVCATDGGGKRGCGQVTIYVDDANDQPPQFQSNTYTETIDEDFGIGERVIIVTASDKDIGVNAELSYGLRSECLVRNSIYTGNDQLDCVDGVREPIYFKVDTEREVNSGFVKLAKAVNFDPPDYHRLFKLNVSVSDGVHLNYTTVFVNIADVNDEAPQFFQPVKNVPVYESIAPFSVITNFSARDLDTNEMNRRFSYSLDRESDGSHQFSIDQYGNLYNLEPLDRELKDKYILRVFAIDEGYPPQTGIATLNLEVLDVNDNYPVFADHYAPVLMENSEPHQFVSSIRAKDLDSPDNGPPYSFEFPDKLNVWPDRKNAKFNLTYVFDQINGDNHANVFSLSQFDREGKDCAFGHGNHGNNQGQLKDEYEIENQCKVIRVPVLMRDSGRPPLSGINYLRVTIGDVNDNLHYSGIKKIVVYDYKGSVSKRVNMIGNVYAEDKDDWDASDKQFKFVPHTDDLIRTYFDLVENVNDLKYSEHFSLPGSIILKAGVPPGDYQFTVSVTDLTRPKYEAQMATVFVSVKKLSEDLVKNSGSFRLSGISVERYVETRYSRDGKSFLSRIQSYLAQDVFNLASDDNLIFFSLMTHGHKSADTVDFRYSAHGSPVFTTQKLNGLLAHHRKHFEHFLLQLHTNIRLTTIGIDECAESERKCKDSGCHTRTIYSNRPSLVNANATSFVGVHAVERHECACKSLQGYSFESMIGRSCSDANYCLNGGMCIKSGSVQKCQCPRGFDGPRCQKTMRSFNSSGGFAWLPSLPQCQHLALSFEFITSNSQGMLFYNGPINSHQQGSGPADPTRYQQDFIALQMDRGRLVFQIKQGLHAKTHSYLLNNHNRTLNDENWHRVDIYKTGFKYRITIDRCLHSISSSSSSSSVFDSPQAKVAHKSSTGQTLVFVNGCEHELQVQIHDLFINSNQYYPLQIGGLYDKNSAPKTLDYKGNFVGCVRNLKVNGELYDLQIDTHRVQGFHMNSVSHCPRADRHCSVMNSTNYCLNGVCDANFRRSECVCKPGYRGAQCELKTLAFDFQTPGINKRAGSYLKYRYVYKSDGRNSAYDLYLKQHTKIQLMFRTRENTTDRAQTLFQITSPNRAQYVYLEIVDNVVQFRFDIGGGESAVSIQSVRVNDGKWHYVKAHRYGREASVVLDDGEGLNMNYTFGLPNGAKEMDVDRDSIFLGAKVVQIKVSGYEISRDYHDSCMMDVRFDGKPLPYLAIEEQEYEDIAIKMESVNVNDGCKSEDYCKGIFCPSNQKCVDKWRLGECQCPKGQFLNGTKCQNLNDCQLCYHQGTKYCEKYDNNQIIAYENFQNGYYEPGAKATVGDYPPDNWYIARELGVESREANKIWRVSDDDSLEASAFRCVCKKGFFGQYCNAQASRRAAVFISPEAISIIVLCIIMSLFLILAFIVYARTKSPTPKHYMLGVDPHDEVRETIINYVEEGCPDVDQSSYDISRLAKPLDPTGSMSSHPLVSNSLNISDGSTAVDGDFPPAIPRQRPPLQEMNYIRRDVPPVTHITGLKAQRPQNNEVGDFINTKLREIDNDPVQPPYDSLQEYAYEGEGSIYGSTLSALEINKLDDSTLIKGKKEDNLDSDLEQMKNWGPKFSKISTIYGLVSDEETNEEK